MTETGLYYDDGDDDRNVLTVNTPLCGNRALPSRNWRDILAA